MFISRRAHSHLCRTYRVEKFKRYFEHSSFESTMASARCCGQLAAITLILALDLKSCAGIFENRDKIVIQDGHLILAPQQGSVQQKGPTSNLANFQGSYFVYINFSSLHIIITSFELLEKSTDMVAICFVFS